MKAVSLFQRRILLGLLLLLAGLALLSRPPAPLTHAGAHQPPLLPRPEVLRVVGAGYIQLIADYFWIQTLNTTGRAQTAAEYRDIYDYAWMVTELDPKFREVYVFAGAALPVQVTPGHWRNTRESTSILERGLKAVPDHLLLRILLAYNWATYAHQYDRAAKLLEETSKMPNAPPYLAALATRMYSRAGDFTSGLLLARSLADAAEDPATKGTFERRVKQLQLERALVVVDHALEAFRAREHRAPADLEELIAAHDLQALPADPFGGQIVLGTDGRAHSTAEPERMDLHAPAPSIVDPGELP